MNYFSLDHSSSLSISLAIVTSSINRSCKIDSLIKQLDIKNPVIKKNCISGVQLMIQSEITFSRIDYHDFIQKLNNILGEKTIKYKFSLLLKNMSNSIDYHKTIANGNRVRS